MSFSDEEKTLVKNAYDHESIPKTPESLREYVHMLAEENEESTSATSNNVAHGWLGKIALAACLVIAVIAGAILGPSLQSQPEIGADAETMVKSSDDVHQVWVQRVVDYQSLYTPHTVAELSPTRLKDAEQLLQSIASERSIDTAIPDLSDFGYTFARAQRLGFEGRALIQLVYQHPTGMPLAFCYMAADSLEAERSSEMQTIHDLGAASWIDQSMHFVLVADESPQVLAAMVDHTTKSFQ